MNEKFIVNKIEIDDQDVTGEVKDWLGSLEFYSKYDFRDNFSEFLQKQYGVKILDLDTAADFGEEGDEIYMVVSPDTCLVQAWGGYTDATEQDSDDDDIVLESKKSSILENTVREVLNESTTLKYKGHSFVLQVKANSDPTKDGLGIRLVPPFGELTPTEQSDIAQDVLQKLNDGLSKYGLMANLDTQVKDKSQIAYFMYTDGFKRLIRKALQNSGKSTEGSEADEQQPEQSGEQQDL